MTKRSS